MSKVHAWKNIKLNFRRGVQNGQRGNENIHNYPYFVRVLCSSNENPYDSQETQYKWNLKCECACVCVCVCVCVCMLWWYSHWCSLAAHCRGCPLKWLKLLEMALCDRCYTGGCRGDGTGVVHWELCKEQEHKYINLCNHRISFLNCPLTWLLVVKWKPPPPSQLCQMGMSGFESWQKLLDKITSPFPLFCRLFSFHFFFQI